MQQLKTTSSTISETPNRNNSYSCNEGSQGAIPISCQDIYNCTSDVKPAQELLNSFSCSSPLEKNLLSVKEEIKEKEESLIEFKQEVDKAVDIERRFDLHLDMGKLTCSNCHQKKLHNKNKCCFSQCASFQLCGDLRLHAKEKYLVDAAKSKIKKLSKISQYLRKKQNAFLSVLKVQGSLLEARSNHS